MKPLLFASLTLAIIGCSGFKPVGPLAKQVPITQQGQPLPGAHTGANVSKPPAIQPTPTVLVTPGEVTTENAPALAAKLASELNTDSKTGTNGPVTAEISRYKGGVKQP